jgi:hypothetical protein
LRFGATSGATSWSGSINHGSMRQMINDKVEQAQFEDFSVTSAATTVKIGRLGWAGNPAATADAGGQKLIADALDLDLTKLVSQNKTPAHVLLSHFELTSSDLVDGAPTRMRAAFDHFSFDLSNLKQSEFAQIAGLGYDKLDLSSRVDAHIDNATHEFGLDTLSLSGADMGAVRVSGRFDQVTKGLLSSDQGDLEAALVKVLLRHIDIRLENTGLFERLVASAAKSSGLTPTAVRKKFTETATAQVTAMLGDTPAADHINAALTKFIADPKTLRLSITAPDGIGALDVILSKDPTALLQSLQIEAAADD